MRPDVLIEQTDGNLGRIAANTDGISALIVSGVSVADKFNVGDILTLYSAQDAIDLGIDQAYDNENKLLAYEHISAFYKGAGDGVKLYVMVVDPAVLISNLVKVGEEYAAKIFSQKKDVKVCIATRLPQAAYNPAYEGQFDADIKLAVTEAQKLVNFEREAPRHRYKQIIIEGYDFQGNASLATDFRTLESGRVSVVVGNDFNVSEREIDGGKPYQKYAFAAFIGGLRAGVTVQTNIGRVKNGKIPVDNVGMSNGVSVQDFTDVQLDTLNKKGLIFAWEHPTKAGYYINQDHSCIAINSDFAYSPNGRVADKVSRITRAVYVEELLDDIEVNPDTGRLEVSVAKAFQAKLQKELDKELVNKNPKEASSIEVYVDPNQNILSTDEIKVETNVVPKGYAQVIKVKQSFINPFNN